MKFFYLSILLIAFQFVISCGENEETNEQSDDDDEAENFPDVELKITISPATLPADGTSTALISVEGYDEDGNPMANNVKVRITVSDNMGSLENNESNVTKYFSNGKAETQFIAGTSPGEVEIKAMVADFNIFRTETLTLMEQ